MLLLLLACVDKGGSGEGDPPGGAGGIGGSGVDSAEPPEEGVCGGRWGNLAAEVWVDAAAAPGGDGSLAAPFATLGEALAVAPGAHIGLAEGIYEEELSFYGEGALVEGACREGVVLAGAVTGEGAFALRELTIGGGLRVEGDGALEGVDFAGVEGAYCLWVTGTAIADGSVFTDCPAGVYADEGDVTLIEPDLRGEFAWDVGIFAWGGRLRVEGGVLEGGHKHGLGFILSGGAMELIGVEVRGTGGEWTGMINMADGTLLVEDSVFVQTYGLLIFDDSVVEVRRTDFLDSGFVPFWAMVGKSEIAAWITIEDVLVDGVSADPAITAPVAAYAFSAAIDATNLEVRGTPYGLAQWTKSIVSCTGCTLPSAWADAGQLTLTATTITAGAYGVVVRDESEHEDPSLALDRVIIQEQSGAGVFLDGDFPASIQGGDLRGGGVGDGIVARGMSASSLTIADTSLDGHRVGLLLDGASATLEGNAWSGNAADLVQQGCEGVEPVAAPEGIAADLCPEQPWTYAEP